MKFQVRTLLIVASAATLLLGGCRSPYHADRGAFWGGLTGLAVGTAVGDHNGNALAGAAIGTAAGTLAGAAIGQSMDNEDARNQAAIEAHMGRRIAGAAKIDDVVAMSQAGLGDQVIITHIQSNGVPKRPSAAELIQMKNKGVSDPVLDAMQQAPLPNMGVARARGPRPVVVEEHYYGDPYHHGYHHPHHYRHRRHSTHWDVSFGH